MKNSKLVKIVLIIMVVGIVLLGLNTRQVLAANNISYEDLTGTIGNNTTNTTNNTTNITNNTTNDTNILKTNNTSNYNNSNLPETGIGDSMPTVILVVVLGISAVYAYKKVQDYRNI